MPRRKLETTTDEIKEREVPLKVAEDEEEDDASPKKVTSDDDEAVSDEILDPLEAEEDEDDPLTDFMPEEESW